MYSQTKVVNRSLENLLKSLVGNKPNELDLALPQTMFAYTWSKNKTTQLHHFEIEYGQNLSGVLDLAPIAPILVVWALMLIRWQIISEEFMTK